MSYISFLQYYLINWRWAYVKKFNSYAGNMYTNDNCNIKLSWPRFKRE